MDARPDDDRSIDDINWIKEQLEVGEIAVTYGYAADAVGRGDVEDGRRLIKTCFTGDAVTNVFFPGQAQDALPAFTFNGPDHWTEGAAKTFATLGYIAAQHHIGNVRVSVRGDTATLKSYVTAIHLIDRSHRIDLVTATYTDQVVRTPDGWRIAARRLYTSSFIPLESPALDAAQRLAGRAAPPADARSQGKSAAAAGSPRGGSAESAGSAVDVSSIRDRMEIEALGVSYAYAADAGSSREVEEGLRLIKTCFTDETVFESYLPNKDPDGPPDYRFVGPEAWSKGAATLGYKAAQHHMGNVQISVRGDTATMVCCVTGTLVNEWNRGIDLVTGSYTDRIERTPDGWRIAHRKLLLTSFLRLESPPAGDFEQQLETADKPAAGAADPGQAAPAPPRQSSSIAGPELPDGRLPDDVGALRARLEIQALAVAYASAADALSCGDMDLGRQIIRGCFTSDAACAIFVPSDAPDAPPFFSSSGPDDWAERVGKGFASFAYTATQHHVGNIQVSLRGDTATMRSCLTATHVFDWTCHIAYATGIYTDHVVRTADGWRISRRELHLTSALRLQSPPRGAAETPLDALTSALPREGSGGA